MCMVLSLSSFSYLVQAFIVLYTTKSLLGNVCCYTSVSSWARLLQASHKMREDYLYLLLQEQSKGYVAVTFNCGFSINPTWTFSFFLIFIFHCVLTSSSHCLKNSVSFFLRLPLAHLLWKSLRPEMKAQWLNSLEDRSEGWCLVCSTCSVGCEPLGSFVYVCCWDITFDALDVC